MSKTAQKRSSWMHFLLRHQAQLIALMLFVSLAIMAGGAYAAAPTAGTSIGNQATAVYNDGVGGAQKSVQSTQVFTIVQQVASLTITSDQTKSVAVGGTVYFLHTVTNTG